VDAATLSVRTIVAVAANAFHIADLRLLSAGADDGIPSHGVGDNVLRRGEAVEVRIF